MYLDKSGSVRCQVGTGWVNVMGRVSGMQLHVASYINTARKMETADSSGKLVSSAIQRITSPKTVSFVNEFCNKSGVFFCCLKFSREIKVNWFVVLLLVDVKLISVLPLFHDFR